MEQNKVVGRLLVLLLTTTSAFLGALTAAVLTTGLWQTLAVAAVSALFIYLALVATTFSVLRFVMNKITKENNE